MYIEQGYKGDIGIWKFWVLPIGFIALMAFNYVSMVYSPVSVDVMMADLIDKLGANMVLIILLAPLVIGLFVVWGWVKLVHFQEEGGLEANPFCLPDMGGHHYCANGGRYPALT